LRTLNNGEPENGRKRGKEGRSRNEPEN